MMLIGMGASAQAEFTQKEMKKVKSLLKLAKLSAPLPRLMTDDRSCVDELYDLAKWDEETAKLKDDSIQKRHEQNCFIKERCNALDEKGRAKAKVALELIDREELRYDLYARECGILESNKKADQRPEPKGELLSVSYSSSGMMHNPDLPFTISKLDEDSALVTYSYRDFKFKVDKKYLDMMREAIMTEHLYQLHSGYHFRKYDLPDIPQHRILDGQEWSFEAKFSDGTVISSSGMITPQQNVGIIPKIYFESVFPNSKVYKARIERQKAKEKGQ